MTGWMKRLTPLRLRNERAVDPEFFNMKTKLTNVATALEACVKGLEAITRDYDRLYEGIRKFASDFYSLYPTDDNVRRLGANTAASVERLIEDAGTRALTSPECANIYIIDRQIKAYLQEIRVLQREFKNVAHSRNEFENLRDRLERLEARRGDDDRKVWLAEQVEEKRRMYQNTMKALNARLASTYNKHEQVFKAAWTAYMLRLDNGRGMIEKHLRRERAYAKKLEKEFVRTQLGRPSGDLQYCIAGAQGCRQTGTCENFLGASAYNRFEDIEYCLKKIARKHFPNFLIAKWRARTSKTHIFKREAKTC